jgi:hypothetical protein
MPLSDVVNINISVESAQLEQEGFGTPLILGFSNRFGPERSRTYTSLAGMVSDGFTTSDVEYRAAQRLFGQTPRPPSLVIARRTNRPTLRWAVTPVPVNNATYQMKVNGTLISVTADASATITEIIALLKTAIDALALPITVSDQTTYMRIVENAAGQWHHVEVLNPQLLGIAQDHSDAGIAADLDALLAENSDWYGLVNPDESSASILAAAAWIEAAKKLYVADTQDSAVETHVLAGATDVAAAIQSAGYARTFAAYHRSNAAFLGAGWMGRVLPIDAGSEMWAYKTLAGVDVMPMTDTQAKNAKDKNANIYVRVFGKNLTEKGTSGAGEYVDVTRGSDWLRYDMGGRVFLAVTEPENGEKLPYDDGGVGVIKNQVRASLMEGVRRGFLKAVPAPVVTAPLVEDISDVDKRARNLPEVTFSAELAGAIQSVTISGVVRA